MAGNEGSRPVSWVFRMAPSAFRSSVWTNEKKGCNLIAALRILVAKDYAILLIWRERLDFRLAALFLWMMLVFANLSSIFCTLG